MGQGGRLSRLIRKKAKLLKFLREIAWRRWKVNNLKKLKSKVSPTLLMELTWISSSRIRGVKMVDSQSSCKGQQLNSKWCPPLHNHALIATTCSAFSRSASVSSHCPSSNSFQLVCWSKGLPSANRRIRPTTQARSQASWALSATERPYSKLTTTFVDPATIFHGLC